MKYDEMKYYDEQKERIILFMKYNVKGFKEIQFEEQKKTQWMVILLVVI